MANRLFKVSHPETATCTIGWLARYAFREFGRQKITEILDAAGIQPKFRAKGKDGQSQPVLSLQEAMTAVREYRKSLNEATRKKQPKCDWVERVKAMLAKYPGAGELKGEIQATEVANEGDADTADNPDGD